MAKRVELGKIEDGLWYYEYWDEEYKSWRRFELNTLFIILAINSVIRLKLLHKDFPSNVDYIKIKPKVPKVIIVFKAKKNF